MENRKIAMVKPKSNLYWPNRRHTLLSRPMHEKDNFPAWWATKATA